MLSTISFHNCFACSNYDGSTDREAADLHRKGTGLSISKLSIFGCTVFMRKRDKDVSKLEPKALEGKFVGYTEGDNGYLVYVPNTRKVVAVRDVIIKESEVSSIPDNTETPDLLDEGHSN